MTFLWVSDEMVKDAHTLAMRKADILFMSRKDTGNGVGHCTDTEEAAPKVDAASSVFIYFKLSSKGFVRTSLGRGALYLYRLPSLS